MPGDHAPAQHAVAEKLRRQLLADIGSGVLPPGAKLGSERELSETYGVSRSTLRHVLAARALYPAPVGAHGAARPLCAVLGFVPGPPVSPTDATYAHPTCACA
jgi:hypothetical protein